MDMVWFLRKGFDIGKRLFSPHRRRKASMESTVSLITQLATRPPTFA